MPIHINAERELRKNKKRRKRNRLHKVTAKNLLKQALAEKDKKKVEKLVPEVTSKIDRLVKRNIIHQNKAGRWKSRLMKHLDSLS